MANNSENSSLTANESQTSMTESLIMSEGVHSTPVANKKTDDNDMIKMMQMLLNEKFSKLYMKFDEQNVKFDEKFSDLKSDVNEIKRQNCNFDERISEIETRLDEIELKNKSTDIDLSLIHI